MVRPLACERARVWASLRLDGELSELEAALLDAHLGRCEECAADVAAFELATTTLRAEPLVPATIRLQPRAGSLRPFIAATAATLLVTFALAGAGFVGVSHVVRADTSKPKLTHVSALAGGATDDYLMLAKSRIVQPVHQILGRPL
jgi:predicted anti-sigma-YlaC factor YlaD